MRNHYIGIADAHGLESFFQEDEKSFGGKKFLQLRASLNRQRHACFYELDLNNFEAGLIKKLMSQRMYRSALNVLKQHTHIVVEKNCKNSWDMIPNSKLDPWYSGEEEDDSSEVVEFKQTTNHVFEA